MNNLSPSFYLFSAYDNMNLSNSLEVPKVQHNKTLRKTILYANMTKSDHLCIISSDLEIMKIVLKK